MANATITVLEADGVTQTDVVVLDVGRQAAAASKSVTLSTEDKAVLDNIADGIPVTGTGTFVVQVDSLISGTTATALGKAEDAQHGSGNVGVMALAVRHDAGGALAGTDQDYIPLITDASGNLRVVVAASTNNIGDVDVLSVVPGTAATSLGKAIDSAAGATDTGVAPLAIRDDTLATLTPVDGDYVPLRTTSTGALWVQDASLNTNGQATAANSSPVVIASDRQNSVVFDVTLSTDTSAYGSGDLIADTQQLDAFFNKADGRGVINSITIIDREAQAAKLYLLFHSTTTSMGTENGTPNISDANAAAGIQGIVTVETTDYITISGTSVACIKNLGIPVKAVSGTDDLYISAVNATGTPTYAATSLNLRIGALLD
jgi:hypothetical protein